MFFFIFPEFELFDKDKVILRFYIKNLKYQIPRRKTYNESQNISKFYFIFA